MIERAVAEAVLTSRIAGETNLETQPWVALGLDTTIDELIVSLRAPTL